MLLGVLHDVMRANATPSWLASAIAALRTPLDHERRSILPIQIVMRWALFVTALAIIL